MKSSWIKLFRPARRVMAPTSVTPIDDVAARRRVATNPALAPQFIVEGPRRVEPGIWRSSKNARPGRSN
jgi:hypothetical protein